MPFTCRSRCQGYQAALIAVSVRPCRTLDHSGSAISSMWH